MKLIELENLFITKLSEKHQLTRRELKKVFHKYDIDGSGYLTTAELCLAIGSFLNGVEAQLIQELVRQYDVDQDGVISLDEFCNFILSRNHLNPAEWITVNHLTNPTSATPGSGPGPRSGAGARGRPDSAPGGAHGRPEKRREEEMGSPSNGKKKILEEEEQEKIWSRGVEQQAKLFLQGMKAMLVKNILDDRGLGRISAMDRLTQKTSQLIAKQSKTILKQLFAPYEASANSSGIPFNGFKRFNLFSSQPSLHSSLTLLGSSRSSFPPDLEPTAMMSLHISTKFVVNQRKRLALRLLIEVSLLLHHRVLGLTFSTLSSLTPAPQWRINLVL